MAFELLHVQHLQKHRVTFRPVYFQLISTTLLICSFICSKIGWGQGRFDSGRPTSLPPPNSNNNMPHDPPPQMSQRASAESSSESEASGVIKNKDNKDKSDKSKGVFRIFSKKKSKNQQ